MPFEIEDPAKTSDETGEETTSSPDPKAEELANLRAELSREKQRFEQLATQTIQLANARKGMEQETKPEVIPDLPNQEEDPVGYMNALVDRKVNEVLKTRVDPLASQFTADRGAVYASAADMAKMRHENANPEIWAEHRAEIEAYLNQFPPEILLKPGALDEATARVVGAKTIAQMKIKGPGGLPQGRSSAPASEAAEKKVTYSDAQLNMMKREGFSPREWSDMHDTRPGTIDEYLALKAKHTPKARS